MNKIDDDFSLVGIRFTKYFYDESVISQRVSPNRKMSGEFELTIEDPGLSPHKYRDRDVIEVAAVVRMTVEDQSESKKAPEKKGKAKRKLATAFELRCVGGFVGRKDEHDGDLQRFKRAAEYYGRAIYWLARQRVRTLSTSTMIASNSLPWDLASTGEHEE